MGFDTNTKARAWIATIQIQNFINMGLSEAEYLNHEYLADFLINLWEESGKDRSAAVAVCMSAEGCYHAHMALYGNTTTLKCVADILYSSHVEPQLGGKAELSAYLAKEGKYAEKGETVLFKRGLENIQDVKGKRSDLEVIEELLLQGYTPQEILEKSFSFYRFEKMITKAYIAQRKKEAPIFSKIYCEYHVGASGSGKTYTYNLLCEQHGAESIYLLTDYDNNASGGLDSYSNQGAPPILFMDELKGYGLGYGKLLSILSGYSHSQTHARYENVFNLWEKVYITSIYPPEDIYAALVSEQYRSVDSFNQLLRRISKIVYHFKDGSDFKSYSVSSDEYTNYEDLVAAAKRANTPTQETLLDLPIDPEENPFTK